MLGMQTEDIKLPELYLALSAPPPILGNNVNLVSWHEIDESDILE